MATTLRSTVPGMPAISLSGLERLGRPTHLRPPLASPPRFTIPKVPRAKAGARPPAPKAPPSISVSAHAPTPTLAQMGLSKSQQKPETIHVNPGNYLAVSAGNPITPLMQLEIASLAGKSLGHQDLFDQVTGGLSAHIGSALSDVMNVVSRPGWAIAGAAQVALEHPLSDTHIHAELHAALQGLHAEKGHQISFTDILKEHHMLDDHTVIRAIAGMTLDIVTDPTNLLLIAATPFTGGTSGEAFLVKEGLLKGLAEQGGDATVKDLIEKTAPHSTMWEDAVSKTPWGQTGKKVGDVDYKTLQDMTHQEVADGLKSMQHSDLFQAIRQEATHWLPRKITLGLWVPPVPFVSAGRQLLIKETTPILGNMVRFMPYAPNTLRIAQGLTKFSHVPFAKGTARQINKVFRKNWEDPITHAMEMVTKHNSNALYNQINDLVHKPFLNALKSMQKNGLTKERALHAFEVATTDGAAVEHADLTRTVDENFLHNHGLDSQQIDFIKQWNDAMNKQIEMETKIYGVKLSKKAYQIGDRVYVPYRVEKGFAEGGFKQVGQIKSFQHARAGERSMQDLADAVKQGGENKNLVTDPASLLKARTRAGAQAMVTQVHRNVMEAMYGIPAKVDDMDEIARLAGKHENYVQGLETMREHILPGMEDSHTRTRALHDLSVAQQHDDLIASTRQGIADKTQLRDQLAAERDLAERNRTAAQAQLRLAAKGVGNPLRHVLTGLMKKAQTVDDLKALWARDAKDAVATNFDLSTVTDKQIALARKQVYERTQASLIKRGMPEDMVVYRAGKLGKGVQSFSLEPIKGFGKQEAYLVKRADVLADANAFFPHAQVLEHEVLAKVEKVVKTTARDVHSEREILAQQQVVKNLKDKLTRKGTARANTLVDILGTAEDHANFLRESDQAALTDTVEARGAEAEGKAHRAEVNRLRVENAELDRRIEAKKAERQEWHDHAENGASRLAESKQQLFHEAKNELHDWLDGLEKDEVNRSRAASTTLREARVRVDKADARVEELIQAKRGKVPKIPQETLDKWQKLYRSNARRFKLNKTATEKYVRDNVDRRIRESAPIKKLTQTEQRVLDEAKAELRDAKAALKKVEPEATRLTETGEKVAQVRQVRTNRVRDIADQIIADLHQEDEKWRKVWLQHDESLVTRPDELSVEETQKIQHTLRQIEALRGGIVELQGKVAAARTKDQLYDLVGDKYGHLIDTVGKRVTQIDSPELKVLRDMRQQLNEAETFADLEALAPGHDALDRLTSDGEEFVDPEHAADMVNAINDELMALGHERATKLNQIAEAVTTEKEHAAANSHLFRKGETFKGKAKARDKEAERRRTAYNSAVDRAGRQANEHADLRAQLTAEVEKLHGMGGLEPRGAVRHHQRTIDRLTREIAADEAGLEPRLAKVLEGGARRRAKLDVQLNEAAARAYRDEAKLVDKMLKAEARVAKGATMANPRIAQEGFHLVKTIPGSAFSKLVKDHIERVEAVMQHPEGFEDVADAVWRTMSRWKLMVTVLNPIGYRVRNSLSDVWNMYLAGVPLRSIPWYYGKAIRMMMKAKTDPAARAFMLRAEAHGVMQGAFRGDIDHAYSVLQNKPVGGRVPGWNKYVRFQINSNTAAENAGRLAHLMYRMDKSKHAWRGPAEDMATAAREVRSAHFDYEDLSHTEQHYFKALMPFYTWTRKNVPYQIRSIIRRPGRIADFSHAMQASESSSPPGSRNDMVPSFFQNAGAIKIPGLGAHWYYLPNIGLMDINRMSTVKGWEQMLTPLLQIPITLATNRNLYTGAQVAPDTHGRVPINPTLGSILSAIPFLSNIADVGMTQRTTPAGGKIRTAGVDPYALYVLESLGVPLLRPIAGHNPIDEQARGGRRVPGIGLPLSTTAAQLGFPIQYVDQAQQRQINSIEFAAWFKKFVEDLQAQGKWPEPPPRRLSPNAALVDRYIQEAYSR